MTRSGWILFPAAFFLILNAAFAAVEYLFFSRLIYFLFLIALFFILKRFDLYKIIKVLVTAVSIIAFIYGIIQKFILFPMYLDTISPGSNEFTQAIIARIQTGRVFSIFKLPTLYAIMCAVLILFLFHYWLQKRKEWFWIILLVLGVLNLILSQSFGGIIFLAVGLLVYLSLSGGLKMKYLAPVIMTLFLFFSITIAFRYQEAKNLEPVTLRFSNWMQAGRMIQSSPFWGVGLGNYESRISLHTLSHEAKSIYAHNFFLQFAAETGLIFCGFLLISFIFSLRWLKTFLPRSHQKNKILYLAIFFVLVAYNCIDIGFYYFDAALTAVIVLSQFFRTPQSASETPLVSSNHLLRQPSFLFNLVAVALLGSLLVVQNISRNYRSEADVLSGQGQYDQAEALYQKSFSINPFDFRSITGFAFLNLNKGNDEVAEQHLDRVLKLYPDSAFAHFLKSKLQIKKGRVLDAYYHASIALEKHPINGQYKNWHHLLKGNLQKNLERIQQ